MDEYKYKGIHITPLIIEELIILLFNDTTNKRDFIANKILDYHTSNGGLLPEAKDYPRSVKKALSRMAQKGLATNKAYGVWRIEKNDSPRIEDKQQEEQLEAESINIDNIPTHTIYGQGDFSLYLYYFENYRKLAKLQDEKTWPCKIGRTDRDPLIRILSQVSTALPEKPTIEFIIKTDDSSLLETLIHSVLKVQGKQIKDAPGAEWFNTNPDEVLEILGYINKQILFPFNDT